METALQPLTDDRAVMLRTSHGTLTTGDYTVGIRIPGTQPTTARRMAAG
ncbi:hypothetical protein [Streptomyces sp. NRRL S-1824]|nr:hypothetical protein [Streptomyces sp. NRRL S-1824]